MKKEFFTDLATAIMILLFTYASFSKYADFSYFKQSMHNQPFEAWFATLLIWALPPMEIITCLLLFFKTTRIAGYYSFLALMVTFTGYILAALLNFFPKVPCSCGGVVMGMGWAAHLIFNLIFIALAFSGLLMLKKHNSYAETNSTDYKNISRAKSG